MQDGAARRLRNSLMGILGFWVPVAWADSESLGSIQGTAATDRVWSERSATGTDNRSVVSASALANTGPVGSPYQALARLPGVSYTPMDPWSVANVQSPNKGLRVRGETAQHGAGDLLEGVPLIGLLPGPGQWLVDSEDLDGLSFWQGAIPVWLSAPATTAGVSDAHLRWPASQPTLTLSQSLGSGQFQRSFARIDTGSLGSLPLSGFVSGSYTRANQWRGPGKAPAGRHNLATAWRWSWGRGSLGVFYVHNDQRSDNYRPLTFAQSQDLSRYGHLGYDANPSSNPLSPEAAAYQGYNHQHFSDDAGILQGQQILGQHGLLRFSAYAAQDRGDYWRGLIQSGRSVVQRSPINSSRWGWILEGRWSAAQGEGRVGWWWDQKWPPHPLLSSALYTPTASGGLSFRGWSILSAPSSPQRFQAVYASWKQWGTDWDLEGGLRYQWERLPGLTAFDTRGLSTEDLDSALAQARPLEARSVDPITLGALLPYLGWRWQPVGTHWLLRANLGSQVASPGMDLWPVMQQNPSLLAQRSAQSLWNQQRLQRTEQADLSWRWAGAHAYLESVAWVGRFRHKAVPVYDAGTGLTWPQNIGTGQLWGVSLATRSALSARWQLAGNASYTRSVFTQDFFSLTGQPLGVSGLQTPDTPLWSANLALDYHRAPWQATWQARYLGARWADSLHQQEIAPSLLQDVHVGREWRWGKQRLQAELWVYNVFDVRAIGFVNAGGLTLDAGANFYPVAGRSAAVNLRWVYG